MAEITDRVAPPWVPTTNELDKIPDDILDVPPAYFSLGSTPQPMNNPPEVGEKGTLIVRYECTGEGKTVRTDGELRYTRKLTVLWAVEDDGTPRPPDPDEPQPSLFDDEDADAFGDDPVALGDILEGVDRPPFSDGGDHA